VSESSVRIERWVCVHGHFYQPPRDNPWTGHIDRQPSATPFHDWNLRITAECYRANVAAPLVNSSGSITRLVNNYSRMSWNMGPTLLSWMREHERTTYEAIIASDRVSRERCGGHGAALAQAHGHLIMPLASRRDKQTQVRWGIEDFRWRFARLPEGMWLPECAVDTETLEVLAAEGILFTVLAPHQASQWRPMRPRDGLWQTSAIDPGRVYRCRLPSGKSIDIFFYDGATSQAVAFDRLLADGGRLVDRLTARGPLEASSSSEQPPLCHIATDGESYGHHHRFGDMALAWALVAMDHDPRVHVSNYAEYRARFPAQHEVQIVEDSSWSCSHGTLRWREDCGCNSGGRPGWKQHWRRPLRDALEWLRDQIDRTLDEVGSLLLRDPWTARDSYIDLMLDPSERSWSRFFTTHSAHPLTLEEQDRVKKLLGASHLGMSMFTSCGWFFDDLSGIETVQILQYAARAAELLNEVGGVDATASFVDRLSLARSNLTEFGDGRNIWHHLVEPARRSVILLSDRESVREQVATVDQELEQLFARSLSLYPLARASLGELPTTLRTMAQVVLRRQAVRELSKPEPSFDRLRLIVESATENAVSLDEPAVSQAASQALATLITRCEEAARQGDPSEDLLGIASATATAVRGLFPTIDLFSARTAAYRLFQMFAADWQRRGQAGDKKSQQRSESLRHITDALNLAPIVES
jgi:hypothetical protein